MNDSNNVSVFDNDTEPTPKLINKNIEYEMKYKNDNGSLKLTEGKQYTVTFEVSEGTFGYDFTIKSIK